MGWQQLEGLDTCLVAPQVVALILARPALALIINSSTQQQAYSAFVLDTSTPEDCLPGKPWSQPNKAGRDASAATKAGYHLSGQTVP
jgi:hypothetical protein